MTTTNTTVFTLSRDDIIQYALRKIGVLEEGVTPPATTVTNANTALNMLVKSWAAKGIKLWTVTELTLPLVSGKVSYGIGNTGPDLITNKPLRIIHAWLRDVAVTPSNDIPLMLVAKHDYNVLGSKGSTGTPNSLFLDVQNTSSTAYFYPTPDSNSSTLYQVHMVVQRPIFDMINSTDSFDFPTEWLYALGWNLAAELATDFGVDAERLQYVEAKALKALTEMEDFDVEQTSIFFTPELRFQR